MLRVESNYAYLLDSSCLNQESRHLCSAEGTVFVPEGITLVVEKPFHLRGGWGQGWMDPGVDLVKGDQITLIYKGSARLPAVWEVIQVDDFLEQAELSGEAAALSR